MIQVWQRTIDGHTQTLAVDEDGVMLSITGSNHDDHEYEPPAVPPDASEDLLRAFWQDGGGGELANLRIRAELLTSATEIDTWLQDALELGLDPL